MGCQTSSFTNNNIKAAKSLNKAGKLPPLFKNRSSDSSWNQTTLEVTGLQAFHFNLNTTKATNLTQSITSTRPDDHSLPKIDQTFNIKEKGNKNSREQISCFISQIEIDSENTVSTPKNKNGSKLKIEEIQKRLQISPSFSQRRKGKKSMRMQQVDPQEHRSIQNSSKASPLLPPLKNLRIKRFSNFKKNTEKSKSGGGSCCQSQLSIAQLQKQSSSSMTKSVIVNRDKKGSVFAIRLNNGSSELFNGNSSIVSCSQDQDQDQESN